MTSGLAQSVQTRLVRRAKAIEVDPNLVLARYATERLLYRLSRSPYADRFVLKGALLLAVWLGETSGPPAMRTCWASGAGDGRSGRHFRRDLRRSGGARRSRV